MDINLKGTTFKQDDLTSISLTDLRVGTVSRHHLFFSFAGGKIISILHAGDLIDNEFIEKYQSRGVKTLLGIEIAREDIILEYKLLWENVKKARTQREKMIARDVLLEKVNKDFLKQDSHSFLNYVIACHEIFFNCPEIVIETYQHRSVILYTRSLMLSAKLSCLTLVGNYLEFDFIKDFYNTAFLLDFGLVIEGQLNYAISQACELERNHPTQGETYLKNSGRPQKEIDLFLNHPNKSFEYAQDFSGNFIYPELLDFIRLHHEKGDGSGFPNGYFYAGMGRTEGLLIFCDYLFPFEEHIFRKGDGIIIFKEHFNNLKDMNVKNMLPIKSFIEMWEQFINWGEQELEAIS